MGSASRVIASLGFFVRTGRAVAIALRGPADAPCILFRRDIALWAERLGKQGPYHTVLDLPWPEAVRAAQPVVREVEGIAAGCLKHLLGEVSAAGYRIRAVGIVGSMGQDPAKIGNPHIRAHAAEGQLFRHAVEVAAQGCGLRYRSFAPAEAAASASAALGQPIDQLDARVQSLGKGLVRPWRTDERSATLAAWAALS